MCMLSAGDLTDVTSIALEIEYTALGLFLILPVLVGVGSRSALEHSDRQTFRTIDIGRDPTLLFAELLLVAST